MLPFGTHRRMATEVLRAGARELLAQAVEANFWKVMRRCARIDAMAIAGTADTDRDRPGGRASAACPGSEPARVPAPSGSRRRSWRYAPHQEPGGFAAGVAILEGHLQRRFLGSVGGVAGGTGHDRATEGSLARRDGALATAWAKRYVYFWVDGIILAPAWKRRQQCTWGATDHGTKELMPSPTATARANNPGARCCSARGLGIGPELVTGDRARLLEGAPPSLRGRPRAALLGA